jgi:hypothetical protein
VREGEECCFVEECKVSNREESRISKCNKLVVYRAKEIMNFKIKQISSISECLIHF